MKFLYLSLYFLMMNLNLCLGEEYDVYLLAGQSNMDGRGDIADLTEDQRVPSKNSLIYYRNPPYTSEGWEALAPGFSIPPKHKKGIPSSKFGPEIGFIEAMTKAQPERKFALIKGSKGGTNLRKDWNPGEKGKPETQGPIYRNFIETYKLATQSLAKDGHAFKIRGLLWHQGESDSKVKARTHEERLEKLIERIREDIGIKNLPWVVGEVFDNGKRDKVRTAIQGVSKNDSLCGLVSSEGTTTWDPGTHFDAKSQLLLGKRYAEEMNKLVRPSNTNNRKK